MARQFKAQINIIKKPYDRPVHYKIDGGRFGAEKTVKFNVNSKYIVELTFRPPQILESLTIQGIKLTVDDHPTKQEEASVYRAEWLTTGLTKCKKGDRQSINLIMQIRGLGELKSQLQCKFYGEHEMQHACWGSALAMIEYECKASESSDFINLVKEVLR